MDKTPVSRQSPKVNADELSSSNGSLRLHEIRHAADSQRDKLVQGNSVYAVQEFIRWATSEGVRY